MVAHALSVAPLRLTPKSRMVAVAMAWHTIDDERIYRKGHGYLCIVLGYQEDDPSGLRAVRRCIAELTDMGVIEIDKAGAWGRTAAYRFP